MQSIKCVVVGDGAVGKTCMMISYTSDRFPTDYIPTVFDNYCANLMFKGKIINLQLWDTAGQEDYDKLRCLSYPQTDVFLIVFSVISRSSLQNVMDKWLPEIQHYSPQIPIVLCGSKIDLREDARVIEMLRRKNQTPISTEEGIKFAQQLSNSCTQDVQYVECSALTQKALAKVFETCIERALEPITKINKKKQKKCEIL